MKKSILICALLASACFGQLRADLNNDGYVNFEDFAILASEWNMSDLSANLVAHYKMDDNIVTCCHVEGTLTPDATGDYYEDGLHNGLMSYKRGDGAYYIWWDGVIVYSISAVKGDASVSWWSYTIDGLYTPSVGGASGTATVTVNTDSKVVLDSSGNDYHGTSVRDTSLMHVAGKVGGALSFNGTTDYINTGQTFQSTFRDSFSIAVWFKFSGEVTDTFANVFGIRGESPGTNLVEILIAGTTGLITAQYISNSDYLCPEGVTIGSIGLNDWHFAVMVATKLTSDTGSCSIYVDGILRDTKTGSIVFSDYTSDLNMAIGSMNYDGENSEFFPGSLDNFMIFNKALSAAEVQELYLSADGGFHRVYRGQDGVIDHNNVVGRMGLNDASVSLANQDLPAGSIWHYVRRQVSECDLESPDSPPCVVVIDSAGEMISNTPNTPANVKIEQVAGGKLRLRWRYIPTGQEIIPTGFHIYMDSGSGFDFDTPLDTVAYRRQIEHSWTSDALTHGQRYKFIVRSYAASAGYSSNTDYVAALADAIGPAAATGVTLNWETV